MTAEKSQGSGRGRGGGGRARGGPGERARGPRPGAACRSACCMNDSLFWLHKKWLKHRRGSRTVRQVAWGGPVALLPRLPLARGFRRQGRQFTAQGGCPAPPGVSVMEAGNRGSSPRAKNELPSESAPLQQHFFLDLICPECSHMATSGHLGALRHVALYSEMRCRCAPLNIVM